MSVPRGKGSKSVRRSGVPGKRASNRSLGTVVRRELQDVVERAGGQQRSLHGPLRSLQAVVWWPRGKSEAAGGSRGLTGGLAAVDGGGRRSLAKDLRDRDGSGGARSSLGRDGGRGPEGDVRG